MKKNNGILIASLVLAVTLMSSCAAAGGIFKAGMWMGVIIVVLVIALVIWLVRKS